MKLKENNDPSQSKKNPNPLWTEFCTNLEKDSPNLVKHHEVKLFLLILAAVLKNRYVPVGNMPSLYDADKLLEHERTLLDQNHTCIDRANGKKRRLNDLYFSALTVAGEESDYLRRFVMRELAQRAPIIP